MKTIYTAIGGRMTKWKGKVVSFAPYVSASIAMGIAASAVFFGSSALAQEVQYSDGAAATIASAEKFTTTYQFGSGEIEALITAGVVTSDVAGSTGALTTALLSNAITATGVANTSTASLDLSLATGTGGTSNAVIATALENLGNDAFARISGSSITSTVTGGADNASAAVSNNMIATSTTLAKSTNMLEGSLATSFANTDIGTVAVMATDYVTGSATIGTTTADLNGGVILQSTQVNNDVQNATSGVGSFTSFSTVATSEINLDVSGGADTSLLSLDSNSIAASFKGASAANTLYVQDGGLSTLSSTAGISNVQVAENVGTTGITELKNAVVASTSGIAATVTGDLSTTSVALTQNSLAASAAQNTATNTMYVADGISVDASGTGRANASGNIDLNSTATSVTADIASADLFVSNVQASADSSIISATNGTVGITLGSSGSAESVAISADSNTISATTTGNKNTGNLIVAGANALDAVVAQTNVQSFADATSNDLNNNATATVTNPLLSVTVASDGDTTVGSSAAISLSSNAVTASSTANSATMATALTGNSMTDGVVSATEVAPAAETDTVGNATVTAGFASVNSQSVTGDADTDSADYVVQSQITDGVGGMGLTVGSAGNSAATPATAGTILTNAALDMSSNAVTSTAKANTGTQSLTVSANDLTASAAVVGQQSLTGGVLSAVSGTTLSLTAVADGDTTNVANVTMTAASNAVTSTAVGNTASNALSVSATTLTAIDTVVADDLTDARTSLSLNSSASAGQSDAAAAMTLLNSQSSTFAKSTDAITATVIDAGISVSLTPDAQTTGSTVTNLTMALDSNSIGATARANLAANSMALDFGSLSLTTAARDSNGNTNDDAGTNVAALGSSQVNTIGVTASVDASGSAASDLTAEITTGLGAINTSSLSASSNAITALASGNGVTNTFALTGTAIQTPDDNADPSYLSVSSTVDTDTYITAQNTAFAVGNEQANSGDITATIGAAAGETIGASALGLRTITDSTIAADGNRVVAQAVAASDSTTTSTVDATAIATSFLAGSRQLNSGDVTASVGATGGLTIEAMTSTTGTFDNSSMTASGNTVGATATATSDVMRLTLGGSTTATLDGSGSVSATEPTTLSSASNSRAIADFVQIESQTNTGDVKATTTDATVQTQTGTTTDSSLASNSNLLTAMATGISGTTAVTGSAASIGGTDAPTFALISTQNSTGVIEGTLNSAEISMTAANTGTTSNSESLSINANTLAAAATAVTSSNTLTTTATGQMAGLQDVSRLGNSNSGAANTNITADRTLLSDQSNSAGVTAAVSGDANITMAVTNGTLGSLLSVASNAIAGTATGVNAANTINSNAGAANGASVGLASSQDGSGDIAASIVAPMISTTLGAAVTSSAVDIASNTVAASATGLNGTNRIAITGGSIAPVNGGGASGAYTSTSSGIPSIDRSFAALTSYQDQSGDVTASVNDDGSGVAPTLKLAITTGTTTSALALTSNTIAATAAAGTVSNTLSQVSDTSVDFDMSGSGLASVQTGTGAVTATIESASVAMTGTTVVDSTITLTNNKATASATGFSATNANTLSAGTDIAGDGATTISSLTNGVSAAQMLSSVLSNTQSNSGVVTATMTTAGSVSGVDAPQVSVDVTAISGDSAVDVSSNTMRAQATGLSADNRSAISGASLTDFNAVTANYQDQSGAVLANLAAPQFSITASSAAGSLATDGNIGVASATGTTATNRLNLTTDTSVAGYATGLNTKTVNLSSNTLSDVNATSLMNSQSGSADVTASINDTNGVGDVLIGSTVSGALTGSVSADSNILVSQARGNVADSAYTMTAGTSITDATQGLLASSQTRSGGDLASKIVSSGASNYDIGVNIGTNVTGSVSVSNNTVRATGTANLALNSMSITAASGIDQLDTSATSAGTSAGAMTTSAQYAVMNGQSNGSDVTSTLTNFAVGVGAASGTNSGSLALNGNMMMADTTGNNAVNSLTLTSGASTTDASASVSNYQTNTGAMSSTITNAEVVMATGATNGSVSASNNAISASAVGNTATSTISTNGSAFKSF